MKRRSAVLPVLMICLLLVPACSSERTERAAYEKMLREEMIAQEKERREKEMLASLARSYAKSFGNQLMESAGGGQDLRTELLDWNYDKLSDELEMKVEVNWNGALVRSNDYCARGVVTCSKGGRNVKFARTYANQNLKDFEIVRGIVRAFDAVANSGK